MASLEHMANLAVCKNFTVRRNVLFWFWHYCQMHAKHVRSAADAKDYLANLMRQGHSSWPIKIISMSREVLHSTIEVHQAR